MTGRSRRAVSISYSLGFDWRIHGRATRIRILGCATSRDGPIRSASRILGRAALPARDDERRRARRRASALLGNGRLAPDVRHGCPPPHLPFPPLAPPQSGVASVALGVVRGFKARDRRFLLELPHEVCEEHGSAVWAAADNHRGDDPTEACPTHWSRIQPIWSRFSVTPAPQPVPERPRHLRLGSASSMPHFQLVTVDGDVLGARHLGRPDWPRGDCVAPR
jgi:hypothetical protein